MKTRFLLLISLALAILPSSAQTIYTPFSWTTIAGNFQQTNLDNGYGGFADGTNTQAQFGAPFSVAADSFGNLYVGDAANYAVRMMTPSGTNWMVSTIAVLPMPGSLKGPGFGTLSFNPLGVAVDTNGNVYVADSYYNAIREITPDGTVTTLAGNPNLTNSQGYQLGGYSNGPANTALFNYPTGVALDNAGNLYVADANNEVIRKIFLPPGATNWQVSTLAGSGDIGYLDGTGTNALFAGPDAVAVDGAGNVYVADFQNNMIRKVTPGGVVTTLAGQNQGIDPAVNDIPYGNADGTGTNAQFFYPCGVAVDAATNVYVADTFNCEIRRVTPQGMVTTLGGTPNFGFYGATEPLGGYQDGSSSVARFNTPTGVAVDAQGDVYVADDSNFLIREATSAPPAVTVTALRVAQSQANVKVSDDIDAPIVPVVDAAALAAAPPLGKGVVADGVTPVLFQIIAAPGDYTCQISLSNNAAWAPLTDNLFAITNGQWTNLNVVSIAGSGATGTNYVYLSGFDWTNIVTLTTDLEAVLTVVSTRSGLSNSAPFSIRPPPVALVHGYNANGSSWSPAFLNELAGIKPADFIIPINYGSDGLKNNTTNTTWTLADLVPLLDATLLQQVETPLRSNWAFTRYDVVCHSQGGVLTRMLCQNFWSETPVVAPGNFFRGRFRRVITIGSPHNGSVLLRYILDLSYSSSLLQRAVNNILVWQNIAQAKFDPFGPQIQHANNPLTPVDPRIKFYCVRTTITEGQPPGPAYNPLCYSVLGLCTSKFTISGQFPGQVLLPKGADGVVDLDSQGAGVGTPGMILPNSPSAPADISHADTTFVFGKIELFGVPPGHSQTSDARTGEVVSGLLAGPTAAFGPFLLPTLLSSAQQMSIDSLVPRISPSPLTLLKPQNLVPPLISGARPARLDGSSNYLAQVELPDGVPVGGDFTWFALVYGTNGASTNGVSFQQDTNDGSQVAISVSDVAQGTVLLFPSYLATNNTLVLGDAIVVQDRPPAPAPSSIYLDPPLLSLPIGGAWPLDLWGQYSNGTSCLLYPPSGPAVFSSSNTNAVTVDALGHVLQVSLGSSVVTATYAGLSAQILVSSSPVGIRKFSGSPVPGGFQLSYLGSYGTTNVIEASSDFVNWVSLATFINTNEFVTYVDQAGTPPAKRFYRVKIP